MKRFIGYPYKSKEESKFVRFMVVVDNGIYEKHGKDHSKVEKLVLDLVNIMNGVSRSFTETERITKIKENSF